MHTGDLNKNVRIIVCYMEYSIISFLSQLFIASTPNHWCRVPELEQWNADVPDLLKSLR